MSNFSHPGIQENDPSFWSVSFGMLRPPRKKLHQNKASYKMGPYNL